MKLSQHLLLKFWREIMLTKGFWEVLLTTGGRQGLGSICCFCNQKLMKNMLNLCVFNTSIDPLKLPFVLGCIIFGKQCLKNSPSYDVWMIKESAVRNSVLFFVNLLFNLYKIEAESLQTWGFSCYILCLNMHSTVDWQMHQPLQPLSTFLQVWCRKIIPSYCLHVS